MHYDQAHQGIQRGKSVKLEIRGKRWILFVALYLGICGNTGKIILQSANTKRYSLQILTCRPVKLLLTSAAAQPDKSWHQTVRCSERRMTSHSYHQQKPGSMLARSTPPETAPARANGTTSIWCPADLGSWCFPKSRYKTLLHIRESRTVNPRPGTISCEPMYHWSMLCEKSRVRNLEKGGCTWLQFWLKEVPPFPSLTEKSRAECLPHISFWLTWNSPSQFGFSWVSYSYVAFCIVGGK